MQRVTMAIADGVAEVRLNRPDKRNAIDPAMFAALADTIAALAESGARCVVLAGEGAGFCAGLDLLSMAGGADDLDLSAVAYGDANLVQQVAWGWRTLPMPVIAALHGQVLGGGLQIAAGADVRFAHPATRFAILEAQWGLVADMAGFALWRGVRGDMLRELAYTARPFDAAEAQAAGFVTHVVDDPLTAARDLARAIASRSPAAVRAAKRLANLYDDADAKTVLAAERAEQQTLLAGAEHREAVRAGMEGRPARFGD